MTPFLLLYYALLVVWLPLLWPAWRLRGGMRVYLLIVAGCGLAAALYEARLWTGTMPSIRLDILLISFALGILYSGAAVNLLWAGWRKAATTLGLALAAAAVVMGLEWNASMRESQRLSEVFRARDTLLFEARFRDPETHERTFGPFGAASHPVGHWEAWDDWQYSRLIINSDGRAWLFYRCEDTECPLISDDAGVTRIEGETGEAWQVTVDWRVMQPRTLRITQAEPDRLSVQFEKRALDFHQAPAPIDPAPAARSLAYLGPFSAIRCQGKHAYVRQLWLWREGERLYGVGIFDPLVAGRWAQFVSPIFLGEGLSQGDAWVFEWERHERAWGASVVLEEPRVRLALQRADKPPEQALLEPTPLFRDEAVELAPLASKADWDTWFEIVLTGHFTSGNVPDC